MLCKLAKKNDAEKWLEVASRFFDKTGKRMPLGVLREALNDVEGVA